MQVGCIQLSPEECKHHMNEGQCIYCAQMSHFLANCLIWDKQNVPCCATLVGPAIFSKLFHLQLTLVTLTSSRSAGLQALIDSEADTYFFDYSLFAEFWLKSEPLGSLLTTKALDGRLLCAYDLRDLRVSHFSCPSGVSETS